MWGDIHPVKNAAVRTAKNWAAGNIFIVWTAAGECLWRRRKWSGTSSGTRRGTSPCSTVSWGTRRWTTVPKSTLAGLVLTIESRRTIIASTRIATRYTYRHRTCRCTRITIARTRPSYKRASSDFAPLRVARLTIVSSLDNGPRTFTVVDRDVGSRSKIRPTWVRNECLRD